jgi:hypothetical protein
MYLDIESISFFLIEILEFSLAFRFVLVWHEGEHGTTFHLKVFHCVFRSPIGGI